jgi:hypothetical protein
MTLILRRDFQLVNVSERELRDGHILAREYCAVSELNAERFCTAVFVDKANDSVKMGFQLQSDYKSTVTSPVWVSAGCYAIYIDLRLFPPLSREQLSYLNWLTHHFQKLEVLFDNCPLLLSGNFGLDKMPENWRFVRRREEGIKTTLQIAVDDEFRDVSINLVNQKDNPSDLIDYEADQSEITLTRPELYDNAIEIVNNACKARKRAKSSVLFTVCPVPCRIPPLNRRKYIKYSIKDVSAQYRWFNTLYYVHTPEKMSFVFVGPHESVAVVLPLLREAFSLYYTISEEIVSERDRTWSMCLGNVVEDPCVFAWARWSFNFVAVRDLIFALVPLNLPPYVILELLDLDFVYRYFTRYQKVRLIESVIRSCRNVIARRVN